MSYDTSKINEKINKIKENSLKVYEKGRTKVISSSEYLKEDKQGAIVVIDDMTEIEHKVEVGLRSKNLVNILAPDYIPSNGYDVLDDNSIRVYANRGYAVGVKYNIKAPAGAKIVISFNSELGGEATGSYNLVHRNGGASIVSNGSTTIMPENGEMQIEFARTGGSGNNKLGWIDIKNLQVEIGDTPTAYAPYIADFSDCKVYARGKNLLNLEGREVVNFGGSLNTDKRQFFNEKGIILGFARNNYYNGYNQQYEWAVNSNSFSYTIKAGWYGIGFDVKLMPNTTYRIGFQSIVGGASLTEYDAEGNYLCDNYSSSVITTKPNTAWGLIVFYNDKGVISAVNPQFEYGSVITEYEPYNEASTEYTTAADGAVEDFNPIFPTMTLSTDTEGALVNINYIKDLQKTYNNLIINTALSGGE